MKKLLLFLAVSATLFSFKGDDSKDQKTLYVDAGHGGYDAGAHSAAGEKESEIVLELAKVVQETGAARNVRVVLIRTEDEYIQLKERAAKTQDAARNSYFVSLHLSASQDKNENGIRLITDKNTQIDGTVAFFRKMMHNCSKLGPTKAESKTLVVLRESRIPAVLVAPGFITNEDDLAKIKTRAYQQSVANAVINAVVME